MRSQRATDYYHLRLPLETERYVFRILAVKAVLGNPGQYGYHLPKGSGYAELNLDRVRVNLDSPVMITTVASAAGITYREFKRLNPEFRADDVPAGNHELKFPSGYGKNFERSFSASRPSASSTAAPQVAVETTIPTESKRPTSSPGNLQFLTRGHDIALEVVGPAQLRKVHLVPAGDTGQGFALLHGVLLHCRRRGGRF